MSAERMDVERYEREVKQMSQLCMRLTGCDPAHVVEYASKVHALAPVLDPTAYRDGMGNIEDAETVARAVAAAQRVLKARPKLYRLMTLARLQEEMSAAVVDVSTAATKGDDEKASKHLARMDELSEEIDGLLETARADLAGDDAT